MSMRSAPLLISLFAGLFAGCSGGGPTTGKLPSGCDESGALCLVECNLGCAGDTCSITDIAPNQPLAFTFSQDIDPRSVDFASFSIKTSTGEEPVGEFFVSGQVVEFVPSVRTRRSGTSFGFVSGETYLLTIPSAATFPNALQSTSGDRLIDTFNCTLRISRPVVDLDGRPPEAELITPSAAQSGAAPRGTNIVLQFSEILDAGPFIDPQPGEEPIDYRLRRTTASSSGGLECNLNSRVFPVSGSTRVTNDIQTSRTVVSFQPSRRLPPGGCIEIGITSRVRDLAGTRATPATFRFVTEVSAAQERSVDFAFDNDLQQDLKRSAGPSWQGGAAEFVALGGTGKHGDFLVDDGTTLTDGSVLFSTDNQVITRKSSGWLNADDTVDDGVFEFTSMDVPANTTVRFQGSNVARIRVRGECRVRGRLVVNGVTVTGDHDGKNSSVGPPFQPGPGQEGSSGGAAAGAGGDGAFGCDGSGNPNQPQFNDFDGFPGEDLAVPGTHAYSGQETGTGGRGSTLFPTHGDSSQLVWAGFGGSFAAEAAAGGGGGGFRGVGEAGEAVFAGSFQNDPPNSDPTQRGAPAPGGIAFDILNRPAGVSSSDFYLVGGSGGGGGGSQPLFANRGTQDPFKFWSGGGGGGGGGVLLLRIGGDLAIRSGGSLEARGGDVEAPSSIGSIGTRGVPAPGGGGSGGSLLVQIGRSLDQQGTIDVRGGEGGPMVLSGFYNCELRGGDGAPGMLRVERPDTAPSFADLGNVEPPAVAENVGVLQERDSFSGVQSEYVAVPDEFFPPLFLRYEVDAVVNGNEVLFSDDPAVGTPALPNSGAALQFLVQGIDIDTATGAPDPDAVPGPWRRYVGDFGPGGVGLNSDATLGFRWALLLDLSVAADVQVREVRIVYQS